MKSFDIDDSIIQNMQLNSVSVKIVDGKVAAEIFCALCQNDTAKKGKLKGKKISTKMEKIPNIGYFPISKNI